MTSSMPRIRPWCTTQLPLCANLNPRTTTHQFPPRSFTTSSQRSQEPESKADSPPLNPRWLSELKSRLGKCITFGLTPSQTKSAGSILSQLSHDWRALVAGSEGYLTGPRHAGLLGHRVVWGDMDCMSHVNNVTYNKWAESARIEWARNFATHADAKRGKEWSELWSPRGDGLILKSIRTDYKFPMTHPDRISVFHKLRSLPTTSTSSFILDVVILSHRQQRPAARCVEDIVVYDYRAGKKTSLRPFMAEAFGETFRMQEEAKRENLARIAKLEEGVRQLEIESWDRADAKEDFGVAA